jgi:hypothetical protein
MNEKAYPRRGKTRCQAYLLCLLENHMKDLLKTKRIILVPALTLTALIIMPACAGTPLNTEASTSGIRAAEEVGASEVPRAALHLQLAKEELEQAKKLDEKGDKERAASLLLRAEADAELAVALSRVSAEKSEAVEAVERVRQLRQDHEQPNNQKESHENQ